MNTAQWPQEIVVKPMEEIVPTINNNNNNNKAVERKVRPQKDQAVNCPRCNSTNTKFCYYNNYSLSQPRYFCKTCRRYWTEGGSLRNIPVGGGSRKNKRSSSSSSTTTTTTTTHTTSSSSSAAMVNKKLPDLVTPVPILHHHHHQNPSKIHEDLNLGFSTHQHHQDFKTISELIQVPNYETNNKEGEDHPHRPSPSSSGAGQLSALELLTGMTSSRGLMSSFIPMPIPDPNNNNNSVYSSFHLPDFKPSLNFSLDGIGNGRGGGYGTHHHTSGSGGGGDGRLFFPFEDLRSGAAPDGGEQDKDNNTPAGEPTGHGYWNGVPW